jgi:hypothetical protein
MFNQEEDSRDDRRPAEQADRQRPLMAGSPTGDQIA